MMGHRILEDMVKTRKRKVKSLFTTSIFCPYFSVPLNQGFIVLPKSTRLSLSTDSLSHTNAKGSQFALLSLSPSNLLKLELKPNHGGNKEW